MFRFLRLKSNFQCFCGLSPGVLRFFKRQTLCKVLLDERINTLNTHRKNLYGNPVLFCGLWFCLSSVRCSAHIQPYFFISIGKVKTCDSKSAGSVARQYIQAMEYVSFETTRNCLNFVALSVIRTLK